MEDAVHVVAFPLVVAALVLGLAPLGAGDDAAGSALPEVQAGPLAVGDGQVEVATPDVDSLAVPLPIDLDSALATDLALCPACAPLVQIDLATEAAPAETAAQPSDAHHDDGPFAVVAGAPPAAIAAGGSALAGLAALLAWLLRPAAGLFSRIDDGDLASHPLRRQALDLIAANPGATVQDIRRALGIAWGTTVYHLGRLEKAGLVAVRRTAGRRGHWPLGQAPPRDALARTPQALADLVRQRPGLSQGELAALAGIGAPAACKQLRRLEDAGLVVARQAGRSRLYAPAVPLAA